MKLLTYYYKNVVSECAGDNLRRWSRDEVVPIDEEESEASCAIGSELQADRYSSEQLSQQ